MGEYQKAKALLETCLIYNEQKFGTEHIETAYVIRRLGNTYCLEGQTEKAINLYKKSLDILRKSNHTDQYVVLEDLAEANLKTSREELVKGNSELSQTFKENGVNNLKEALNIVKENFPQNSPHVKRIKLKIEQNK
jgi:tetratricopeptide (TPR) repeat protein